ncbi:MAG: hypothetical protein LBK99_03895 [Opitutaceae bacterium]|jgi:hypothetical protein|nr:hypothetical protein [Opitutaceae bacterium]
MTNTNPNTGPTIDLGAFLQNPGFAAALDSAWDADAGAYRNLDATSAADLAAPGIQQYLLIYHTYQALANARNTAAPHHSARAIPLARYLAANVTTDGLIREPDGTLSDHPANACHVLDGLATFAHYARRFGSDADIITAIDAARAAVVRIVENHPVIRLPDGICGRTQQMRFELRAWYWAWRLTGQEHYKNACLALWENGIHAYQAPIAHAGGLLQPSLHPDYTWNYTCTSGTTTEYATNTHTPVYYCTEQQGFLFVYLHGLREGVFKHGDHPQRDVFCRHYIAGLLRNLSRAGHTASDLDGYGVHRAWYGGCLLESVPVEAAAFAAHDTTNGHHHPIPAGWFRWYVDRYAEFLQRSPTFATNGLVARFPYGHKITIEKQFPVLNGARFYAQLARALYEYNLGAIPPVEPPPALDYAWWHNWARISTPRYETSFVGTTSLCNIPAVHKYGDPNLGCIHGGAPLATLMSGNQLLYATSNDPAGLWHMELVDVNGNTHRSIATSFEDETSLSIATADGKLYTRDSFEPYTSPLRIPFPDTTDASTQPGDVSGKAAIASTLAWSRNLRAQGIRFFVKNAYTRDAIELCWGASFPTGIYLRSAAFCLAIPAPLAPEITFDATAPATATATTNWQPLVAGHRRDTGWPRALRWHSGSGDDARTVTVLCAPASATLREHGLDVVAIPADKRRPGGENSFCPYPILQVRLWLRPHTTLSRVELRQQLGFSLPA